MDGDVTQEGKVYRIVGPDGTPAKAGMYRSRLKALYATLTSAKRALQHYRKGSYIEEGTVTWQKMQ